MKYITDIYEFKDFGEASLENKSRILRGVSIMSSGRSKNNRLYSKTAMEKIASFISEGGVRMFLDHPDSDHITKKDGVRSIRDFAGVFSSGRVTSGQVRSDVQIVPTHWPLMESLVTMNAPVGFSINSRVMVRKNEKGEDVVEDVDSLRSVDLVTSPALTSTIMESHFDKLENKDIEESIKEFLLILDGRDPKLEDPKSLKESIDEFMKCCGGK